MNDLAVSYALFVWKISTPNAEPSDATRHIQRASGSNVVISSTLTYSPHSHSGG